MAIDFRGISKAFGGVQALSDISFTVASGSCHAICGENGAGKSTLGKILAGIERPDSGTIEIDGVARSLRSPRDARAAGIAIVHQELAFCDNLSVAENLCLSALPRRGLFVDRERCLERATEILAGVGATIDPRRRIAELSVAEQQLTQIAAAVGDGARVIIFDEPTSSLDQADADRLYGVIRALKARGVTMLYVSHRMPEIFSLCDTITVLRDGRHVVTRPAAELSDEALVQAMIGRPLAEYLPAHVNQTHGDVRLRVERLASPGRFNDMSFEVRGGEILGLCGLVGAGRTQIADAIFGLDQASTGNVMIDGRRVACGSPRDAMGHGIGYVPEDRKRLGLVLSMAAGQNVSLPSIGSFASRGFISRNREATAIDRQFAQLSVRGSAAAPTTTLSGGNQQKLVMAKWLARDCGVLLLDEPTRGVDVGAKAELHGWIDRLACDGRAILLISSELPELLALSTRILVLRAGEVVGEQRRAEATQESLMRFMTGAR